MGALIWSSRAATPLHTKASLLGTLNLSVFLADLPGSAQIAVAISLQFLALLACYGRSETLRDMPSSPEGALIMVNIALCILAPVLIRQAWRWHVG